MASRKDINSSPQKGGFQNYSPYRKWNNLNLRQMMTARLPCHRRLLPQAPWRLARLIVCHHMTPTKEKSTCSSRRSVRKKYFLACNSVGVCILALRLGLNLDCRTWRKWQQIFLVIAVTEHFHLFPLRATMRFKVLTSGLLQESPLSCFLHFPSKSSEASKVATWWVQIKQWNWTCLKYLDSF